MPTELKDPAAAQVVMQRLHAQNEELMAYMKPTDEQRARVRRNCVRIAHLALQVHDFYKENTF